MAERRLLPVLLLAVSLFAVTVSAGPARGQDAAALPGAPPIRDLASIDRVVLPAVDPEEILAADERRVLAGRVPHYAVPLEAGITPWGDHGEWRLRRGNLARWRLRISSPGALSLNLAFSRYRMPPGGRLLLLSADGRHRVGPFTERDNDDHGELWTPPIATDDLVLDLQLPVEEIDALELELRRVQHGYAGFGDAEPHSGDCHRDVACSEAEAWSDQARSVALLSIAGTRYCTGFLVNNTALDGRPFLITANHCGVTPRNAPSVVVLWGYQRGACGADGPASEPDWSRFQSGAILRAAHPPSDTALLELDDPPDPAFGVYYAGWDRTAADPARTTVIHHPGSDVKKISFDFDRALTTPHLFDQPRPGADHLRVGEWDLGSTEGGSSGAPLFNRDRRVVGQLHGGHADCGAARPDWFGRFSAAWTGRGRPGFRLSDWLDPLATGATVLDGLDGAAVAGEPGLAE